MTKVTMEQLNVLLTTSETFDMFVRSLCNLESLFAVMDEDCQAIFAYPTLAQILMDYNYDDLIDDITRWREVTLQNLAQIEVTK